MEGNKKHIVLVHGACHGAWSWYKVSTILRKAGHQVTVPDLSASGIHSKKLSEVPTFADYSQPLIDIVASLPPGERVILVGHSLGGLNIALAMDRFPERIAAAVFVAAFMPDSTSPPSFVLDKLPSPSTKPFWMDTEWGCPEQPPTSMLFGPQFLSFKLYQLCSPEDVMLATTLVRVGSLFLPDLSSKQPFSEDRYGSVSRVYVVCQQDGALVEDFQRWMINNYPTREVKEIKGADHMAMLSKPNELAQFLLDIAEAYA